MTPASSSPERLAEVTRLCTLLADRALDAQIMGRPVPPEQVAALAKAAQLLQDHGIDWPPLLKQVLHEVTQGAGETSATAQEPAPHFNALGEPDLQGLTRFFAGFRRERGEA